MTIVMQGVVHGRTIELEASPGVDDGHVVQVILNVDRPPADDAESGRYVSAAGMMADYTDDDDAVLEEIYQERHRDARADIEP
jgi:hypothetical protein